MATTKKSKVSSAVLLEPMDLTGKAVLQITDARTDEIYDLQVLECDFGQLGLQVAKRSRKPGEDPYDVLIDGDNSHCDCTGFLQHGKCKHVRHLRDMAESGTLLPHPDSYEASQPQPTWEEDEWHNREGL